MFLFTRIRTYSSTEQCFNLHIRATPYSCLCIAGLLTRLLVPRPRRDRDCSRHNSRRDRDEMFVIRGETETRRDRDVYINGRNETETRRLFYCLKYYIGPCEMHVQQCLITLHPSPHVISYAMPM